MKKIIWQENIKGEKYAALENQIMSKIKSKYSPPLTNHLFLSQLITWQFDKGMLNHISSSWFSWIFRYLLFWLQFKSKVSRPKSTDNFVSYLDPYATEG